MTANHSLHICLGIPIPLSVQALPRSPPASFHHLGDLSSLRALKKFGREFKVPSDEIEQACNLASGPSNITIILERPKTRSSHEYGHPFPRFVRNCKTLWAVDELIRFATNGARSIHTVTVLDAFSFKPNDERDIPDERCHQLLAEILRAKKPKVVLRCHRDEYRDPWMKQFELPGENYKFARTECPAGGDHRTIVLQSFHPSLAVNNAARRPEYRCLLIYHFVAAFAELSGVSQLHEDAEDIRQLCTKKKERDDQKLSDWEAPTYLTEALQRRYGSPGGGYPVKFANDPEYETLRTKARILSTMYDWLEHLAGQSHTFGALGIAEAVLFLWKEHFKSNPLYEQVTTLLFHSGSKQQGWFPMSNHKLPLTGDLYRLHINSPDVSGRIIPGLHSPQIIEVNRQAVLCISNTLASEEGKEVGKIRLKHTYYRAACNEIAKLVIAQNLLVNTYVRTSTLAQLSRILKIQNLVTQCEVMADIIKMEEFCLDEPKEKICKDLSLLRLYLQQLITT